MKRGVAWSLVFMLVLIVLTITATILVFWGWWNPFKENTSKAACELRLQRYCLMKVCDRAPDTDLKGCEQYGYEANPTKKWCEDNGFKCK